MAGLLSSPLVMLMALTAASLVAGQPVAQETEEGRSKERDNNPIAFPGTDAFGHISGLKKNSTSGYASRPSKPPPLASAAGTPEGAGATSSECLSSVRRLIRWANVSPFHDSYATAGHSSLPDVRLAVDSMFRITNQLESLLRDPMGTNLLYSPVSLVSTLGQIMLAARGRTLDDLLRLLLPPSLLQQGESGGCGDAFHASFRSLLAQVWSRRGSESHELSVRNALFHQQQGAPALHRAFTGRLARDYATEIFPTDFRNNPIYAQQQVNLWGNKASKGKIDQLMPYVPPRTTVAIMSSVMYFKAVWENQFNKQFTTKSTFFLDGDYRGRTKAMDFMSGEFELPYVESKALGCKMVALPYTNNETAMYLLMPLGSSKWKGPRPLPPLSIAPDDALSSRSGVDASDQGGLRRTAYHSGGAIYYGSLPRTGSRPVQYSTPTKSYTYPRASNPQRLKRRQAAEGREEGTRSYDPSSCQGGQCQPPEASISDSPFSALKLHELANRLGAAEFNSLVALSRQSLPTRVSLFLPKLSMTSNVKLREALAAMGVGTVFGDDADLSGAVNRTEAADGDGGRWGIDEVWQQSRLEVTEVGTEAASGTAAVIVDYSLDSAIFKANSPFLAVIRHETTGAPIFWASVANPS